MPHRCAWTNQEADNLKEVVLLVPDRLGTRPAPKTFYVLPEYEQNLRRFIRSLQRFGLAFVLWMLVLTIATPIAAAMRWYTLLGVIVMLTGVVVIAFPFATPETVKRLGIQKSIRLVRAIGIIIVCVAIYASTK